MILPTKFKTNFPALKENSFRKNCLRSLLNQTYQVKNSSQSIEKGFLINLEADIYFLIYLKTEYFKEMRIFRNPTLIAFCSNV